MRGVFYKPKYSKLLDEYIAPSPDAVAHALARNYGWTIFPCGDTALNLLGHQVGGFRLPMTEATPQETEFIRDLLRKYDLLS